MIDKNYKVKDNILFYYDVEIMIGDEEHNTTFHYGDDAKEFVENEFKQQNY